MKEESKEELQKLLMHMYEKGANDAEAAMKEAIEYGIDVAIKAEREACAKVCEDEARQSGSDHEAGGMYWCAEKIRARSKHEQD